MKAIFIFLRRKPGGSLQKVKVSGEVEIENASVEDVTDMILNAEVAVNGNAQLRAHFSLEEV